MQRTAANVHWEAAARQRTLLHNVALVFAASVLMAVCAKVQIPLWPVPVTLQPFAVLLIGATLGSTRGALAIGLYLLQGLAGLPVFAVPPYGGVAYLMGPTAGYLFGFVLAAFVVGWLSERGWTERLLPTLATFAVGQVILLTTGLAWLILLSGAAEAMAIGLTPFVFGEALKLLLAALILPLVRRGTAWAM